MDDIVLQEFMYLLRICLVVKSVLLNGWQKVKLGPVRDFINFPSKQIIRILLNLKASFFVVSRSARHRSPNLF
jgi:hypothetical protein